LGYFPHRVGRSASASQRNLNDVRVRSFILYGAPPRYQVYQLKLYNGPSRAKCVLEVNAETDIPFLDAGRSNSFAIGAIAIAARERSSRGKVGLADYIPHFSCDQTFTTLNR
jgi:hypothetical protein